ncbi:MAG: SAM-dependent DNA methyltransferase, partial [Cyanobacteria bacterium J06642_12]
MSEHSEVRLPLIDDLIKLGWDKNQLQYEPEWRVPKTPSEAGKRELGQSFKSFPIDVAIFDHPSHVGEYEHLQIIVETKAPKKVEGISQLKIYMSLEPHVLLGIWTNGSDITLVYRTSDGKFDVQENAVLPKPTDSLIRAGDKKLKWSDLRDPSTSDLKKIFKRLLDVIVSRDTKSTRRDDQLNNLCNVILAKLEGDKAAKYSPDDPVPFQVWNSEKETDSKIRHLFQGMRRSHKDLFLSDTDTSINFDPHTLSACAFELSKYKLMDTPINVISEAFQIFRTS